MGGAAYCYWILCPRGHWDPGCVSNWFVSLNNIATIWTISYKYLHLNLQWWQKLVGLSLAYILLIVRRWKSASYDTEMQAITCSMSAIPHIYHIWGMVIKYYQYKVFNFADKLRIATIYSFTLLSV